MFVWKKRKLEITNKSAKNHGKAVLSTMVFYVMFLLSICCPIVEIGIIASDAIGESSKPTMRYSSGRNPYFRIIRFKSILACVSFAINIPFLKPE